MKHYRELVSAINRRKALTVFVGLSILVVPSLVFAIVSAVNPGTASLAASPETTYFAEIDKNGIVTRVIVADRAFINSGYVGDPKNWIQTSKDGSMRKNGAATGYTYDKTRDAFIPPKPEGSTVFDEEKAQWIPPVKLPPHPASFYVASSTPQ